MSTAVRTRLVAIGCFGLAAVVGLTGCNSSSNASSPPKTASPTTATSSITDSAASTDSAGSTGSPTGSGGSAGGPTDYSAVCSKIPVADAQALVRPTLSAAVPDERLGGCSFVLPGNDTGGSNLTVGFQVGNGATDRYNGDVNGTFSAGGSTVSVGAGTTTPLAGVGDKAVWGSTVGYPSVSALKGNVYCTVLTADDATKLTIIGSPTYPLPQGTPAQEAQYAQLEGKLCSDLFSAVQ